MSWQDSIISNLFSISSKQTLFETFLKTKIKQSKYLIKEKKLGKNINKTGVNNFLRNSNIPHFSHHHYGQMAIVSGHVLIS